MAKSLEDYTLPELIAEHRTSLEKNRLFDTLMSDPETRRDALALVKKKNPTMPIPELEVEARNDAALAEERKEREKLETRVRQSEIRESMRVERERVKSEYGLNDADVIEVEKLMLDEKAPIPHYDAAAKVYKASRAQAEPTSSQLSVKTYDMPDKGTWARGVGDKMGLDKVFREKAYEAVNEVRRGGKAA